VGEIFGTGSLIAYGEGSWLKESGILGKWLLDSRLNILGGRLKG